MMPAGRKRGGDFKGMVGERRLKNVVRLMVEAGRPLSAEETASMFNNRYRKGQFTSREMGLLLSRRSRLFSKSAPLPGEVMVYTPKKEAVEWL